MLGLYRDCNVSNNCLYAVERPRVFFHSSSITNPLFLIDNDATGMSLVPFFDGDPAVPAIYIIIVVIGVINGVAIAVIPVAISGIAIAGITIAITGAIKGEEAKSDIETAMVIVTAVRISVVDHGKNASRESCRSNK